ncbi:MAG: GH92 family glycosyl hydrolase [Prevotella sp.]|nr:GH92 family glycosyl hydrolase [Prevotella sp.]
MVWIVMVWLWLSPCVANGLAGCVDPRIGSVGLGRVFIGPCAPFGMAKPGPDAVSMPNAGWAPIPEMVKGFSQTHVSGTGGGQKYGNVLIQPILMADHPVGTGLLLPSGEVVQVPVYGYRRQSEQVALGYYTCTYDNGIRTEITASDRCALYRFSGATGLLIDVASFLGMDTIPNKREAQQFVSSAVEVTSMQEVSGYTSVRGGWNNGDAYKVYFSLQSDVPFENVQRGEHYYIKVGFGRPVVHVKVGISYVSIDQARRNIVAQDFDKQRRTLANQWETMLARVPYHGTDKEMRMFYTALYHTLLMPVDKTGENPKWQGGDYYDDYYALWDTYRTSFPLLMDYYPEHAAAMIRSLLNIYQHEGYMPDARSGDCNGRTQGGSNAEVVIADAMARGLQGIDYELALQAMIKDAEVPPEDDEKEGRGGLEEYNRLGYVPYGIPRAGTRTVEYSFDDWCIAQVARRLGHDDLYRKYLQRSGNWRNLWRGDYEWQGMRGFILPRDAEGRWLDSVVWGKSKVFHPRIPYKPDTKVAPWYIAWWDTFFYEALSAEYSLSIPHDVPALIELCGGDSAFRQRLDTFFDNGHYNVANEPSFLTPYLYHYIGRADLSARRVSEIVNHHFSDTPDGLPGNDDSGAMSAWLVWAMMGRYPVMGASPRPSSGRGEPSGPQYLKIPPVRIVEKDKQQEPMSEATASREGGKDGDTKVSFVLNRQYRTWSCRFSWEKDTLLVRCNDCIYRIPQTAVEHATRFCWDSPYRPGKSYAADGTFLFVSRDALRTLMDTHTFVYDGITWREQDRTDNLIHVKADIDGTEMWIDTTSWLPFVVQMKDNPLGIDWHLTR